MPGLLAFHAHPDDEVTSTGGVLARYADAGEHVVVVTATDGAEGDIHNYDNPEEIRPRLVEVRAQEMAESARILGISRHHFLGYRDSGMMGTDPNRHPDCFWQADFMDATERLVRLIRCHQPEVITLYDPFGSYGHPDHIQVHRIGMAAFFGADDVRRFPLQEGEDIGKPAKLYMSSWPRSRVQTLTNARLEAGLITEQEAKEQGGWGTPDDDITALVDVVAWIDRKVAALRAHRTQIPEDWFMLAVPDRHVPTVLGVEAFQRIYSRVEGAPFRETDLFAGLRPGGPASKTHPASSAVSRP